MEAKIYKHTGKMSLQIQTLGQVQTPEFQDESQIIK